MKQKITAPVTLATSLRFKFEACIDSSSFRFVFQALATVSYVQNVSNGEKRRSCKQIPSDIL